jgi:tetratricopeptide (TPR) repeat protein
MTQYKNIISKIPAIPFLGILFLGLAISSCKKYLDKKPDPSLSVPGTLADLQALLDYPEMNSSPGYLELPSDNYYITTASWQAVTPVDQPLNYNWAGDARITTDNYVWSTPYSNIYYSNLILETLPGISANGSSINTYNAIKGSALFHRGFQFYQLAQLFCKPYSASADIDLGIVLRKSSNVNEHYSRATVAQTYNQAAADLLEAVKLLPVATAYKTRPNKGAAFGMLSRIYLSMREYVKAGQYADSTLSLSSTLLDYNQLMPLGNPSLPADYTSNPEVLFTSVAGATILSPPTAIIDSGLYQSYQVNDLRKKVFFGSYGNNKYYWRGSYHSLQNSFSIFCGITTDELYLIRAECYARAGDATSALTYLNNLLRKRWLTGTFTDIIAVDANDALAKILVERRKELIYRGLRWTDLRRFNLEGANITLKRIINNTEYMLPPGDPRWTLLIPEAEINRSGIQQNPR